MKNLLFALMCVLSTSVFSQIDEIGTLKVYSEKVDISKEECLELMSKKYGKWICKLQAIDLSTEYKLVDQKLRSHEYRYDDCKLIILRKMDRIEVRVGEYDEKSTIEKVNSCLNKAKNEGYLKTEFIFSALKE